MKWAALIAWVVTAGGGFVLLSIWLARGGMRQRGAASARIRPPLIMSHFLLAGTGLVGRVPRWYDAEKDLRRVIQWSVNGMCCAIGTGSSACC